jgi:hypothetical protein
MDHTKAGVAAAAVVTMLTGCAAWGLGGESRVPRAKLFF